MMPEKYKSRLEKLDDLMKPLSNFKKYRELLASKPKEVPCIPCLAVILRDMEFTREGNSGSGYQKSRLTLILIAV